MNAETMPSGVRRLEAYRSRRRHSFVKSLFQCCVVGVLAFLTYFTISHYVVQSVRVVGVSMVPTLQDAQHYLLNRWVYYFHQPKRADIVVLRDPMDNGFAVKRVIGVQGDSIYIKDGGVFLNGKPLQEPYLAPGTPTFIYGHAHNQLIVCGNDQFFVLGDNRPNSVDSRVYGAVPRKNILGMIIR